MYYSYADAQKTRHMLRQSAEQTHCLPAQLQCNLDSLHAMVSRPHLATVIVSCSSLQCLACNSNMRPCCPCYEPVHIAAHALQIEYCEEKLRCRRVLLMGHFGESFDPGLCKGTCDICSRADGRTFRGAIRTPARRRTFPLRSRACR